MYEMTPNVRLTNCTGVISCYKITSRLCFCHMEITPQIVDNDTMLAFGLWKPAHKFYLSLPTNLGGTIPCYLNENGELIIYYNNYDKLDRIDFCFTYPYKVN